MNRKVARDPSPAGGDPRVIIFTAYDDLYAPLVDIAAPNWMDYCEARGYGLRFYKEFHLDPARTETYGDKVKHTLYYDLAGHCDIAMFLDADSLFMNPDVRAEQRLGRARFMFTFSEDGPLSGLWIARTDPVTEHHLRYAYEQAAVENNVRRGVIEPNGISDQDSMRRLMTVPPFSSTFANCQDALRVGHCFPENYYPGAWIITFPGRSVENKLALMTDWAAR